MFTPVDNILAEYVNFHLGIADNAQYTLQQRKGALVVAAKTLQALQGLLRARGEHHPTASGSAQGLAYNFRDTYTRLRKTR